MSTREKNTLERKLKRKVSLISAQINAQKKVWKPLRKIKTNCANVIRAG